MTRGQAPLLHRRRREAREADDVADGVDVGHLRLIVLVDSKPPALVGLYSRSVEPERIGRAPPADAVEGLVGDDLLAAGEMQSDMVAVIVVVRLDRRHGFAEMKNRPVRAQVIDERLDDLPVDERQQLGARVDERDADAERGEHARVLETDDAGADDRNRPREVLDAQEIVARENVLTVTRRERVMHDRRPHRDDDGRGGRLADGAVRELEPDAVRIHE